MEQEDKNTINESQSSVSKFFKTLNSVSEEDLEEFLLTQGYDIFDNADDVKNRVIDSCKVIDIAYEHGFIIIDPDDDKHRCGYIFERQNDDMSVNKQSTKEAREAVPGKSKEKTSILGELKENMDSIAPQQADTANRKKEQTEL